jgi:hypothetical protein
LNDLTSSRSSPTPNAAAVINHSINRLLGESDAAPRWLAAVFLS